MSASALRHGLFVFDDEAALESRMAPFLDAGVEDGEAVICVVDGDKWSLLRRALGDVADEISHVDRDTFYTRPEAALAGYDARVRRLLHEGAPSVRAFAELPRCETDEQWSPWIGYEAMINRAFAHHPFWVICGYDSREVSADVLHGMRCAHPHVEGDGRPASEDYRNPDELVRELASPAESLPELRPVPLHGAGRPFRVALLAEMAAAGVPEVDAEQLVLAAGEVLANALTHGGGSVAVRAGRGDGGFVCEISDAGAGLDDPMAGYLPPRPGAGGGAGLWVARQLTRRLDLVSSPDGLSVRLWT
jgi:anti-sigma regulatory factor (Ser/Thr protein kinase)